MQEQHDLERLMKEAIAIAQKGIAARQSPFGAVIANAQGEIIATAHNTVRTTTDPTAHAEVNAIRAACESLNTLDLSGYVMATTCEPCPMCASAIHWARLDAVAYGATITDAAQAGFNELHVSCESLYETGRSTVSVHGQILRKECANLFQAWQSGPNPSPY